MKKFVKAVVFDLDGTLLNTLEDLADSVNFALRQFHCPERSREEIRRFLGNGVQNLISKSVPEGKEHPQFTQILQTFRAYYSLHCHDNTAPYPGIPELLRELKNRELKLAIVSNKFDKAVKELNSLYFGNLIPVAIGETEAVRKKPAPDTVLKALEELQCPVESAIYVGDSEVDIQTGINAKMPCITVTWGFRDEADLCKWGATMLAKKPKDILKFL